jgi:enoyl-CoA hydratase/carnithine racemase
MIELTREGTVFVLRMNDDENWFHPSTLDDLGLALADVEATDGAKALVTVGSGRFFTNWLDLVHIEAHPNDLLPYLYRVHALYARVLSLPCATVAAVNGHAFGAGAMLALAHDQRIMRTDRGYWCLPEVDLGMTFTPGMNALVAATLPIATVREAMLTGRRYGAEDAVAAGIVHATASEADLLAAATAHAASLADKAGTNVGAIRTRLYEEVLHQLRVDHHPTPD